MAVGEASTSRRIPQLDLLRAVAILMVVGHHLVLPRPGGAVGAVATAWYRVGWIGVDLFFVLSGFLIGGLLINEAQTHGAVDVKRFLVRRGLKIYPAYYVFVAYVIFRPVAGALADGRPLGTELRHQLGESWPNLFFIQNYVHTGTAQHLWSIAVEEHFYLILPFVVAALALRRSSKLITIGLVAVPVFLVIRIASSAVGGAYAERMAGTHLRLDALLFGVALRALLEKHPEGFVGMRRWRLPLVLVGVACWAPNLWISPEATWTRTAGLTLTLLGAGAFLVATYTTSAADLGRVRPHAEPLVKALCSVGVFSYAIYLWHVTAIGSLSNVAERTVGRVLGSGQIGWLVSATLISAGVMAIGAVMATIVEKPVLRIRDRIAPSRAPSLPVEDRSPREASEV